MFAMCCRGRKSGWDRESWVVVGGCDLRKRYKIENGKMSNSFSCVGSLVCGSIHPQVQPHVAVDND